MDELEHSPTHVIVFGSLTWKNMPPEQFVVDRWLQGYRSDVANVPLPLTSIIRALNNLENSTSASLKVT
jgi:hypothetical protein